MYMQHTINILMTFLAIICPYLPCRDICLGSCVAALSESVSVQETASATCCHHRDSEEQDQHSENQEQRPVQPKCPQDGNQPNCFCGGAVIATVVDCPSLIDAGSFSEFLVVDLNDVAHMSFRLVCLRHTANRGCPSPPLSSGREICHLSAAYLL